MDGGMRASNPQASQPMQLGTQSSDDRDGIEVARQNDSHGAQVAPGWVWGRWCFLICMRHARAYDWGG